MQPPTIFDLVAQYLNLKSPPKAFPYSLLDHPYLSPIVHNPLNIFLLLIFLYLLIPLLVPVSLDKLSPTVSTAKFVKTTGLSSGSSAGFGGVSGGESSYSYLPANHPLSTEWKKYTPRSLAIHDGTGGAAGEEKGSGKILLCINRKVFDVTSGGRFYGPGGPYGNFAGRDASRGMAKQSFDQDVLTPLDKPVDTLTDLTPAELTNMKEWQSHFSAKYPVVGELVDNGEA